jgi:SulP family sulfate permease
MTNIAPPFPVSWTTVFPDDEQLASFLCYLELLQVKAGEFLFREGDHPDGVYLIVSGQLSPVLELANGQLQRLQTFGVGEVVGEGECYWDVPRLVSLRADCHSYLYHLSSYAWARMEREDAAIAAEFHKYLLGLLAIRFNLNERLLNCLRN